MREVKATLAHVLGFRAPNRSAPLAQAASVKGAFADFLAKLLTFESGIDPEKFAGYVREYESPVMRYPLSCTSALSLPPRSISCSPPCSASLRSPLRSITRLSRL